jgi:hypothetical protein
MGRGPKGSGKRAAGGLAERGRASLLLFFSKLKILKEVSRWSGWSIRIAIMHQSNFASFKGRLWLWYFRGATNSNVRSLFTPRDARRDFILDPCRSPVAMEADGGE